MITISACSHRAGFARRLPGFALVWYLLLSLARTGVATLARADEATEARIEALKPELEAYIAAGMNNFDLPGLAIGIVTRRGMLWSLGFVMVGEQTIMPAIASLAQLSPQQLAKASYAGLGPLGEALERCGRPTGWGAVVRLFVIAAIGLLVTERALRRVTILSGAD